MAEIKDYSTTAANNNSASPDGMPEGMAPSGVNNSWREGKARLKRWYEDVSAVNSLAGGTTAYTLAASRTISAYAAGDHFVAVCNATNTGASTLNVDSVGAKNIVTTSQTALGANQLIANGIYVFSYDATNDVFICLNPNLEIQDQTAVTSLADTDVFAVHDGALKKITVANMKSTFIQMKTGTYTGDGATSQAITGVGFQPQYVKIVPRETVNNTNVGIFETWTEVMDDNAAGGAIKHTGSGGHDFSTNTIISLDSDGFTVDDNGSDQNPNENSQVYNYVCFG